MRIVMDLDGTLSDGKHREHFITGETKDWDAFFAACDKDGYHAPVVDVLRTLHKAGHSIEIWTGRSEGPGGSVRLKTHQWLEYYVGAGWFASIPSEAYFSGTAHALSLIPIRMRPHGDYTQDHDLKKLWLDEARAAGRPPELVFEDRDRVVAMWRAEGIPCFQVAPGEF